eukprot:s3031_g4.t1
MDSRPFASLVNEQPGEPGEARANASETPNVAFEPEVGGTMSTAGARLADYMDFRDEGMEEDLDLDRTLLAEEEEEDENMPASADEARFAALLEEGPSKEQMEAESAQDPFSATPGATSFTFIRTTLQHLSRGLVAKKLDASNNFELSFELVLLQTAKERRGVAHFSVGGSTRSQLPRVCIPPGSTKLYFFLRQGSFRAKLATAPIPRNRLVRVSFRLVQHVISVSVDDVEQATASADGLQVPVPAKMFAYFDGPGDIAAEAMVGNAVYRWRHFTLRPRVQATTIFELPPDEIQLMVEVTDELKKSKKWAKFDAFFGMIVFANAVSMGIQTDCRCADDVVWQILDNVFLVAFIIELILRAVFSGLRQFSAMIVSDHWLQLDMMVISLSVVDTWILGDLGSGGVFALARLYRLLKLVKMVRLLRTFRQLAMLVEGILSSLQTLFRAVLLLALSIYMFSVLLVRMAQWDVDAVKDASLPFTSLPTAMWTLVQLSTFDKWVELVRVAAFQLGGLHGGAVAIVLLICVCLTGLGIMNLVVGILCNTAFKLESRQVRMVGAERLLKQQGALELFRQQLLKHGTHLLKNPRYIAKEEFFEALQDSGIKEIIQILNLTDKDFDMLVSALEENNDIEIDGIIEAIGIIELQSYFAQSVANSVKKHKAATALRPVDLLFFCISLRQLEASMEKVDRHGRSMCAFAYDALSILYARAEESYTLLRLTHDVRWTPPASKMESTQSSLNVRKMEETANQFNLDTEEQKLLMPIDILFGSVIAVNGAFVGVQTMQDDGNVLVYWIDLAFTFVFTLEFILRGVLAANLNYVHQTEEGDSDLNFFQQASRKVARFAKLRSRVRCWILPPCPPGGVLSVLSATCRSLKEFSVSFDFTIIVLSLLDSLVIVQLRNAGVLELDTSALSVLRAFRLFRLAKLLRIFRLFPQLQKLVFALIETWRQVFWALMLILLLLYAFSIYAVSMIGRDAAQGSTSKSYYGTLTDSFLTGWQVTTFDRWDEVLYTSTDNLLHFCMLLLVAVVLGLGLMNMAVGVVCEAAMSLQAKDDADVQRAELIAFLSAMKNLQETCVRELGDQILPASLMEDAIGLKMNPPLGRSIAGQSAMNNQLSFAQDQLHSFLPKLQEFLGDAGLHRLLVKRVRDKVDHGRTGLVTVDDFTKGALVTKEDLAKVELYGCTVALREVRAKCLKMNECILNIHMSLQLVLEEMCAVIHRKNQSNDDGQSASGVMHVDGMEYDPSTLRPEAERAVMEMGKWSGEGSLPQILNMGTLFVSAGTGKIDVSGDEVVGFGTAFRAEVQIGDIIIVEPLVAQKHGDFASKKTFAMAVTVVLSQTRLKVATFVTDSLPDHMVFVVARFQKVVQIPPPNTPFSGMTAHEPKQLSPRSSQCWFEWDLKTQKRDMVNLQEAEAHHSYLKRLKKQAEFELLTVLERPLLRMCFQALKSQVRLRQKTVSLLW